MLVALVFAADTATTFDLSDRSEVRLRTTQQLTEPAGTTAPPGTAAVAVGVDLFTQITAALQATNRRWDFAVVYSPVALLPDLELGVTPTITQSGHVSIIRRERRWALRLYEDGSFGQQNSAYLLPAQVAPGQLPSVQPVAAPTTIDYGFSHTYAGVELQIDRGNRAAVAAEYLVSGGTNEASQAVVPEQYGPRASVSLLSTLSRRDQLSTLASAQRVVFTSALCVTATGEVSAPNGTDNVCAPHSDLAQVEEQLTHRVSRSTTWSLGAGVVDIDTRTTSSSPYQDSLVPLIDAAVNHSFGHAGTSTFSALGRLGPYVDVRSGLAIESLSTQLSLVNRLSRMVSLQIGAGAGQGIATDAAGAGTVVQGNVELSLHLLKELDLGIGERGLWQGENGFGSFVSTFGYFAMTVRERTLHF